MFLEEYLPESSKDGGVLCQYDTLNVASVYSVQIQNQVPQNLSCPLASQRKIGN